MKSGVEIAQSQAQFAVTMDGDHETKKVPFPLVSTPIAHYSGRSHMLHVEIGRVPTNAARCESRPLLQNYAASLQTRAEKR